MVRGVHGRPGELVQKLVEVVNSHEAELVMILNQPMAAKTVLGRLLTSKTATVKTVQHLHQASTNR